MKTFILFTTILLLAFSCKQNKETYPEMVIKEVAIDNNDIESLEKEIEDIAIGGEGILFEDGKMSFDIQSLEESANKIEDQLNDMKNDNSYESEAIKQNAIESMELNLNLFKGEFCCTNHHQKHCEDSQQLRKLQKEYDCNRFIKKE